MLNQQLKELTADGYVGDAVGGLGCVHHGEDASAVARVRSGGRGPSRVAAGGCKEGGVNYYSIGNFPFKGLPEAGLPT